jgi:vacuolar-type H+-ATPase subunit D/Vma8
MQVVEGFFKNQVTVFDAAVRMESDLRDDLSYLQNEDEANKALNQIRLITVVKAGDSSVYKRIPELNGLMDKVRTGHNRLLEAKRDELLEIVRQCMSEIHTAAESDSKNIISASDNYYGQMKEKISTTKKLVVLDGFKVQLWTYKDDTLERIAVAKKPAPPVTSPDEKKPLVQKKVIKDVYRQQFPSKTLETQADVDAYVERMRAYLTSLLKDCDGIKLK